MKAALLLCLKDKIKFPATEPISQSADLEGSVLVNILKPNNSKAFTDYSVDFFFAAIRKYITKLDRVDIVFEAYKRYSLKAATRKK